MSCFLATWQKFVHLLGFGNPLIIISTLLWHLRSLASLHYLGFTKAWQKSVFPPCKHRSVKPFFSTSVHKVFKAWTLPLPWGNWILLHQSMLFAVSNGKKFFNNATQGETIIKVWMHLWQWKTIFCMKNCFELGINFLVFRALEPCLQLGSYQGDFCLSKHAPNGKIVRQLSWIWNSVLNSINGVGLICDAIEFS